MAKQMNRREIWEGLIEAETNERYFGWVSTFCRWVDATAKLLLILAAIGSLAAVIAESQHQLWLAWLSFVAAVIEVIVKPVANWETVGRRANEWRVKWIDVRESMKDLWREAALMQPNDTLAADKPLKMMVAIEKGDGYVPKLQWLVDRIARQVERRLGA